MFNRPPVLGPVVTLEGSLLQTVKDFINHNGLDIEKYAHWSDGEPRMDLFPGPMIFSVRPQEGGSPSGYAMNIQTKNGSIHLPAGGQIFIGHGAGRIDSIDSTLPLRTLSFEEVMALARQIDDNITSLGYKAKIAYRNMTEEEFQEKLRKSFGANLYAKWDAGAGGVIAMRIKPFSKYARVAFTTPIGRAPNREAPETYLLDFYMGVGFPVMEEISALRKARRLALTGDKEGRFPVKIWFDDPDWRPDDWQGQWIK